MMGLKDGGQSNSMKTSKTFKYDDDVVKLFEDFYKTLIKAGYKTIYIKKDKEAKQ